MNTIDFQVMVMAVVDRSRDLGFEPYFSLNSFIQIHLIDWKKLFKPIDLDGDISKFTQREVK